MSDQLRVEYDSLRSASSSLRTIEDRFRLTGTDAQQAARAVGHAGLSGCLADFASDWSIRRERAAEQIAQLREAIDAVVQSFGDADGSLAAVSRGAAT